MRTDFIDLRSDTVTRPTTQMLDAMMSAKVGDDVFGEDPTVNALEKKVAEMFEREAAIFCPSGTMTNQIAVNILSEPLSEIICDKLSHIHLYEGGGPAFNSRVTLKLLNGNRGRFTADEVLQNINPDDVHLPITKVVAVENTCNKGGGSIYDFEEIKKIAKVCHKKDLRFHLDGARLFNALAETSETAADYGKTFDTISLCLSKGLGAPVGSVLISDGEKIKKARRLRKVLGGGMRQAGYFAAAGIYALENNIARLKDDHSRAKGILQALEHASFVEEVLPVQTNIVIFRLNAKYSDEVFLQKLKEKHILVVSMAPRLMRLVTHLDFNDDMLQKVLEAIKTL